MSCLRLLIPTSADLECSPVFSVRSRFVTKTDGVEDSLKRSTYGLVHLADFKETREKIEEEARRKAVQGEADK